MSHRYVPTSRAKKLMQLAIKGYNPQKPEELILVLEKIKREDIKPIFQEPKQSFAYSRYKE